MVSSEVYFLSEGSKSIGHGHITRCKAISEAFEERGIDSYFIINGDETIDLLLQGERYIVFDWIGLFGKLDSFVTKNDIVIVDSLLISEIRKGKSDEMSM